MPKDSTHRIINYLILSVFILLNFFFNLEHDFTIIIVFMIAYVIGSEFLSPDLDTNSRPSQRLGILSYPIRKLSKHRGLSHNILIGWSLKVLYILIIIVAILIVIDKAGLSSYIPKIQISNEMIYASLLGIFLSNLIHIITDRISTFCKRHT